MMPILRAVRIDPGESYRVTVDLLSEMRGILDGICLITPFPASDLGKFLLKIWSAFLGASAEKYADLAFFNSTVRSQSLLCHAHYLRRLSTQSYFIRGCRNSVHHRYTFNDFKEL